MMIGNLMIYTEPLKYRLTLLKPAYQEMSVLKEAYNIEYKGSLRDMNELSFSLPYYINEEINANFSKLKNGYLIYVELYSEENDTVFLKEHFLIDRIENNANDKEVKNVSCLGLEQQLSKKLLKNFSGVKKLYRTPTEIAGYISSEQYPTEQDFINSGILNVVTNLCPSWSVGEIDDDVNELYRDILVDSDSVLSFLRNTVQTSFSCLFSFDSTKKEINVLNLTNLGVNRGFFISENNYIKSLKETIDDSDVVTKLNIFGKDELTIRSVNPTGETYILDLSYYRNTDYMSQSLLDALDNYDALMSSKSEEFQTFLTDLNTYTTQLNTKNSQLSILKGDLETLETQKDGLIVNGSDLGDINSDIDKKQIDITNIENEINSLQSNIDNGTQEIEDLQTIILMENNFTLQQIEELDYYIKEKTVRDNTFTDAQELYDEGTKVIKRLSQPSVQFDMDIVDLFDLVECQLDWNKVTLGDIGTIKFEKFNRDVELRLIAYTHNYEDNKLSLIFGNRKNLNDPNMLIDDLKSSVASSVSLDINKYKYLDYINSGDKTAIYQYINGLLDLGTQGAVAGSNQEVKIDSRGITLTNPSEPQKQVRLMADGIYFTIDGWQTSKIALSSEYGITAEIVRGILGEYATLRADQIIVGDAGQKIDDGVIASADNWNNAEQNAKNYANAVRQDLQNQIDGNITTWFYEGEPTLSNNPAINWSDNTEKDKHLGDLYYDNSTGYVFRFRKNVDIYEWFKITDTDITTALANAQNAQDTADNKRRVFVTTPTPPYDAGDLWSGGTSGDLKKCKTPKSSGQSYNSSDWELASKYTDDTVANDALNKANNSVQQDTLYNKVLISSQNGIQVLDNNSTERVKLGNYATGKYGLLLKDSTGSKTILSEDGILQTWQEGRTDNVDASHPLKLNIFVPENTKSIHQCILRFKMEKFRAYSTGASNGGSSTRTSSPSSESTTENGGDSTRTSRSGGGGDISSYSGGGKEITTDSYAGRHRHKIADYINDYGFSGSENKYKFRDISGSSVYVELKTDRYRDLYTYDEDGAHGHVIDIPSHAHTVSIGPHTHEIDIPSHKHDMEHTHDISIPSHSHGINYGIYDSIQPSIITVKINGTDFGGSFNTDKNNLNISSYINIGQWNSVELASNRLGRIDATVFVQSLMGV